jgi:VWFA-related protein
MMRRPIALLAVLAMFTIALSQNRPKQTDEQPIRISTQLVQLDVVVTDKSGKVVRGLNKDDFELFENGKKQEIKFFEFVDAGKGLTSEAGGAAGAGPPRQQLPTSQGISAAEVRRIFAFVVDDLTIRSTDLIFVRQMLNGFVDNQMRPTDLVGIFRTIGREGLFQQFTTDKDLLHRAIAMLTPQTNAFGAFNPNADPQFSLGSARPTAASGSGDTGADSSVMANPGGVGVSGTDIFNQPTDINSTTDETNMMLRSYMTLGTATFIVDSMRELPGRKAMVLVSGGLPIFGASASTVTGNIDFWLNSLADQATRAGVAINTMDIRGLSAQVGVAHFTDTPGRSGLGAGGARPQFGRQADESMLGSSHPFDVTEGHMGLKQLASATGGLAVLNRNDFNKGLESIVDSNDAYYLIAYSPPDTNFKGEFRKLEYKVKGGYKVLSRKGYFAKEEAPPAPPTAKDQQILEAIKSPLARREIYLDAMLLYKAAKDGKGAIDIHLLIDPNMLKFEQVGDLHGMNVDVAGFVFDHLGKLRGGFSKTLNASLTAEEFAKIQKVGLSYPADTELPPGIYQIRIGVLDNKTGAIGTVSRYVEVPDLSKGQFFASSLLLGSVPVGDTKATEPVPIPGNRQISRKGDLRYASILYNARRKDGNNRVTCELTISQNGKVLHKEQPQLIKSKDPSQSQMLAVGQLGLAHVPNGRYLLTMMITDELADKKDRTVVRSMDFRVVD